MRYYICLIIAMVLLLCSVQRSPAPSTGGGGTSFQGAGQNVYVAIGGSDLNSGLSANTPLATVPHAIAVANLIASNGTPAVVNLGVGYFDCKTNVMVLGTNVSLVGVGQGVSILGSTCWGNTNDHTTGLSAYSYLVPGNNSLLYDFSLRMYPQDVISVSNTWGYFQSIGSTPSHWSGLGATYDTYPFTNVLVDAVSIEGGEYDSMAIGTLATFTNTYSITFQDCQFGTIQYPARCDAFAVIGCSSNSVFRILNCIAYQDPGIFSPVGLQGDGAPYDFGPSPYQTWLRISSPGRIIINGYQTVMTNSIISQGSDWWGSPWQSIGIACRDQIAYGDRPPEINNCSLRIGATTWSLSSVPGQGGYLGTGTSNIFSGQVNVTLPVLNQAYSYGFAQTMSPGWSTSGTNTLVVTASGLTNNTTYNYSVSVTAGTSLVVKDGNGNQFLAPVLNNSFPLKPGWRFTGTAVTGIAVRQ